VLPQCVHIMSFSSNSKLHVLGQVEGVNQPTNQLHGAESSLGIRKLHSCSKNSQYFMEPGGSLPCSQEPAPGPYREPDKSNSYHPISLRFILILSSHLYLGLPCGLFPSCFPTKILYAFLFSFMRATYDSNLILLDLIILVTSTSYNAPLYAVFSSTSCSQIPSSLCSSNNIRHQVSHPYRTTGKNYYYYYYYYYYC
jgi:hypothetical protein